MMLTLPFFFSSKTFLEFMKANVMIVGGGDLFSKEIAPLAKLIPLVAIVSKLFFSKRVVFLNVGVYNPLSPVVRTLVLISMRLADFVSLRDTVSLNKVAPFLGQKSVKLTSDALLWLDQPDSERISKLLSTSFDRPLIGLTLRYVNERGLNQLLIKTISELIDRLTETKKAKVIFFPMDVSMRTMGEDFGDQFLAKEIQEKLSRRESFHIIDTVGFTPEDVKGVVSSLDVLISMRLIPIIIAESTDIPFIALSSSEKISGWVEMIGKRPIDIRSINTEEIFKLVTEQLKQREQIE